MPPPKDPIKRAKWAEKISKSNQGHTVSKETRKKISKARQGTCHTEETKKKIRKTLSGHVITKETREKISKSHQGKHHSEETKKRIGEINLGRILSKETKKKISVTKTGISRSKETKKKLSGANLGKIPSKETKRKMREASLGKTHSETTREKLRIINTGRWKGEKSGMWKGGISRLPYPFKFNSELTECIREKYNHVCAVCKLTQEQIGHTLCVHHIDYNKNNLDQDNLISLCRSCHSKTNSNRNYWSTILQNMVKLN